MANHPSAEKRNRQRIGRTERNRRVKGNARTLVKKARIVFASAKPKDTAKALLDAVKAVDRAASKGVVHSKTAARIKSRLAKAALKSRTASGA
jgi:small subunit ribosomal protein S20